MIISDCYPSDLTDGRHLRVYNLSKELCRKYDCYFVGLSAGQQSVEPDGELGFQDSVAFEKRIRRSGKWRRWFRLSNAHYVSQSSPEFFSKSVSRIDELAKKWEIDAVILFDAGFAEIVMTLDLPRVLDFPDCVTLMLKRRLENRNRAHSIPDRLRMRLNYIRARNWQKYIISGFTRTATISAQDRAQMLDDSAIGESRICVIPNGVSTKSIGSENGVRKDPRSIVFWGNLDFSPNWAAVRFFYEKVFLPYLAGQDVVWHIVGAGASEDIKKIGRHEQIVLAGFQDSLDDYVAGMGAMINPMVEGGGLKNKVLEAFVLEIPVVSTTMGAEAIDCVAGRDFLAADTPARFAEQILAILDDSQLAASLVNNAKELVKEKYTWRTVGKMYADIVDEVMR